MTRLLPIGLIAAGVVAVAGLSFGSKPDKEKEKEKTEKVDLAQKFKGITKQELMAAKLKGSQALMQYIALNDFARLSETSEDLAQIARTIAFMNSYKGVEYEFHMTTFRRAVEMIGTKAKDRNMDGVLVAFNDMTLSCLKCHNGIRDKKFALLPRDESGSVVGR